jgi:hypothetical protein
MSRKEPRDDQRDLLAQIVASVEMSDRPAQLRQLARAVSASMSAYRAETKAILRPDHSAQLRSLVALVLANDPSIGLIRTRIQTMPRVVVEMIEAIARRRAEQVPALEPLAIGLCAWSKSATPSSLVRLLRLCLVEGGMMVPGRARPTGHRSATHFEAMILGRGRGLRGVSKHVGGRPPLDFEVRLIALLAVDWLLVLGLPPEPGRDGRSPFSNLVHSVFDWLGIGQHAQHCLREYWYAFRAKGSIGMTEKG